MTTGGSGQIATRGGSADEVASQIAVVALARVLGVQATVLRADTPLSSIGWDSLARLCWEDAIAEAGWSCVAADSARTIGDLIGVSHPGSAP